MGTYVFTERVRKVLKFAREEAIHLQHDYVGTEHILLALVREGEGVAAAVLHHAGIELDAVTQRVLDSVRPGRGGPVGGGEIPYTSRAKKTLEYSMAAARELNDSHVGTEHILLGLLKEEHGIGAQVLLSFGLNLERANSETLKVLGITRPGRAQKPFRVQVDDASDRSIYEQIIAQIQEGVATGGLHPGDRLPAVRQLADELDIAPGTVARAYSELERLGVVVTEGARGTRIADRTARFAESPDRAETLTGLLRPVAVAAFHLGASAPDLRTALERAMVGIFDSPASPEGS